MSFIEKIKEFILGIDKPVRLYFYFSVFDTLVGLVGMLVYGILTSTDGPFWIRNQYIGIWLLLLITLYGIISIYLETKRMKRERRAKFYFELAFFLPTTVISLVMSVYFGISGKIDSTIWSVYICAVSFTNCYIVFLKTKRIDNEQSGSEPGEETVLTEGSNEDRNPRLLSAINISLKIASLVILCFVLNGAIEIGAGKIKYPARGQFLHVNLEDGTGRDYKIHYVCDGPVNSSLPVFILEGNNTQSHADFLVLQSLLAKKNRRSCIWDKPGVGYSEYLLTDAVNAAETVYHGFVKSLDENPPYAFVAWGTGGGKLVYDYSIKHPEMVKSITFLDVEPSNLGLKIESSLKNWTSENLRVNDEKKSNERVGLIRYANILGVPFGLMQNEVSKTESPINKLSEEARWFYLTEKYWKAEDHYYRLNIKLNVLDKVNEAIPISLFITSNSDEQIRDKMCKMKKINVDSAECLYEINFNRESIFERVNLFSSGLNQSNVIKIFSDSKMDSDHLISKGAEITANHLLLL